MENFEFIVGVLCLIAIILVIYVTITVSSLNKRIDEFISTIRSNTVKVNNDLKTIENNNIEIKTEIIKIKDNINCIGNVIDNNNKTAKDKLNIINNSIREFRIETTESIKKLHTRSKAKNSYKKKNDTTILEQENNQ